MVPVVQQRAGVSCMIQPSGRFRSGVEHAKSASHVGGCDRDRRRRALRGTKIFLEKSPILQLIR